MGDYINLLMFLVDKYHLKFTAQDFPSCPFGNYTTKTYSFYNDTGCFTISYLLQKNELDFYFSNTFSSKYASLCKKLLNVWVEEPEIWRKHRNKHPFFWWNKKKILSALAEVIREKIHKNNEFFGVVVELN